MMTVFICMGCRREWVNQQMDLFGEPINTAEPVEIQEIHCSQCQEKIARNEALYG